MTDPPAIRTAYPYVEDVKPGPAFLVLAAVLAAGCTDSNHFPVTAHNERGDSIDLDVAFIPDGSGKRTDLRFHLGSNETHTQQWTLPVESGRFNVTAAGLSHEEYASICSSASLAVNVNPTAITLRYSRGDGFVGC